MQANGAANQFWRYDIAFQKLSYGKDPGNDADPEPIGCVGDGLTVNHFAVAPILKNGEANSQDAAHNRPDIRDERDKAGNEPDNNAEVQTSKR